MSTTNREQRKQAKRKAWERSRARGRTTTKAAPRGPAAPDAARFFGWDPGYHDTQDAKTRRGLDLIANGHHETRAAIAAETEPEDGRYLDRLPAEERMRLMRDQKTERVSESVRASREAYAAEVERYHGELSRRAEYLRGRLFGVGDAGALSRAALATDAELGAMLELAAHAGNDELGRAVFVASEQRGLGDLMARYFDRMDPEARGLYSEWAEVPPAEGFERQKDVEALIPNPDPDRLMPPAVANT